MKRARTSGDDGDDQLVVRRDGTMVGSGPKILRRCSSGGGGGVQQQQEEDWISSLPDHILVFILSLMGGRGEVEGEIEQVVRTSVLARRWRYLWRDSLKSLSFSLDQHMSFHEDYEAYKATCSAFVNRVNLILHFHPGDTINDFTLNFWSDSESTYMEEQDNLFDYASSKTVDAYMEEADNWFGFALSKRVKRLSFNFTLCPHRFALTPNLIQERNMDSLVSLCLDLVDVTGEVLEYLLTVCGSLEHLSISESTTLVDFTVSGPRLKLKHLQIHACEGLHRLCIRDVKLVSFDYEDMSGSTVFIENTPHLVNGRFLDMYNPAKILSYLPQLQALVLEIQFTVRPAMEFPKLMNLVRLELGLGITDFICAICASLLVSSPSVRELKLLFISLNENCSEGEVERLKRPHESLEVVELVGFVGCQVDTGVALYLIENTLSLERIIVDTSHPMRSLAKETRERARAKAKEQLGPRLLHTRTRFSLT